MPKNLNTFHQKVHFVLTDIDDTLTDHGQLGPEAYQAIWNLHRLGIKIIPVTGRPAGWCEMIARMWPVAGVIGENGGFYFRYHNQKMQRYFFFSSKEQDLHRQQLKKIQDDILLQVPGSSLASDQFCRMMDLAIDFCEDVPALSTQDVAKIVQIFNSYGAQAKVSSIHVNGWFGSYNKLSMSLHFLQKEFGLSQQEALEQCAYCGDSPNDEPMFDFFQYSIGVANVKQFLSTMKSPPKFISHSAGGQGFAEISQRLIECYTKSTNKWILYYKKACCNFINFLG